MTIRTSDLDFTSIKESLRSFLEQQDEFKDYDFSSSGLSYILDVLAYNTHINGLTANLAINESFLSTSQLRGSVLSHASMLGYTPKSKTAAEAKVLASVIIPGGPTQVAFPAGTRFSGGVDGSNYEFQNTETVFSPRGENDTYTFDLNIKEGSRVEKNFIVGTASDENVYLIDDKNIDTTTLKVIVYDNANNLSVYTAYSNIDKVATINENSSVYMIKEISNGGYELLFGDGNVLGKAPIAGNLIKISYLRTQGAVANGVTSFVSSGLLLDGTYYPVATTTLSESSGGAEKENIRTIKKRAPLSFTTQNRLVTADDYKSMILKNYSSHIRDAITWGGNDNIPPEYGKVFVSLNYRDNVSDEVQQQEENAIRTSLIKNLAIMSIDAEFVKPVTTHLELSVTFNVDAAQKSYSLEAMKSAVNTLIVSYTSSNLNKFNSVFRRSNLLAEIDGLSQYILNSKVDVRIQQRINMDKIISDIESQLSQNGIDDTEFEDFVEQDYTVNFPTTLASPDKDDHIITSTVFKSGGTNVIIKNELGSTKLQLVDLDGIVRISNVGTYSPAKGVVSISALKVDKGGYVGEGIKISATPANQSTIRPLRNYILSLDESELKISAYNDKGASEISL